MHTTPYKSISFSHTGKRSGNEDCLVTGTVGNKVFFMVCDGVGGQDKGEVASSLACESFQRFFEENAHKEIDQSFIHEAISSIQAAFNAYISQHPEASQMATTLTLAILHPHGISMSPSLFVVGFHSC